MEADLILVADAYCSAKSIGRPRLSRILLQGGAALDRVAEGATLTVRSWQASMGWLSKNWPDGALWPEGIDRPAPAAFTEFPRSKRVHRRAARVPHAAEASAS